MFGSSDTELELEHDFQAAHDPTEDYGGIPGALLSKANATQLQGLLENNGFRNLPIQFDSQQIFREIEASNPAQPQRNDPPSQSATWQRLFDMAKGGLIIPPPYVDVKATDGRKLAAMTSAYRTVMAGSLPRAELPDIRDVFLDAALPLLTFRPAPGLDGKGILVQMCQQCHNSRLDQTLSRARFNVERLDDMSRTEKDEAIRRLGLPSDDALRMPPQRFRDLPPEAIELVVTELSR
jgi:hypothetical protein